MSALKRMMVVAATALLLAGCGNTVAPPADLGTAGDMPAGGFDMMPPACVMNPMTSVEILNACTSAQTGDPNKDYPYFPAMAPGGKLPPLP